MAQLVATKPAGDFLDLSLEWLDRTTILRLLAPLANIDQTGVVDAIVKQ